MKVSILCADLSSNCLGRSYILARVLEREFKVEIVGPLFGEGIWTPLASESIALRPLKVARHLGGIGAIRQLAALADGDLLYANKTLATSFGAALIARHYRPRPLLLDIDDWDAAFVRDAYAKLRGRARLRYLLSSIARPHMSHAYLNAPLLERWVDCADGITVSNRFLQQRFGGALIRHGRDTDAFRPGRFDRNERRQAHGLDPNRPVVLFLGTMHPYKGVDDLIDALRDVGDDRPQLLLVGVGEDPQARQTLARARRELGGDVVSFGPQPFERLPEFMALADIAAIPQRDAASTRGQMPAKLFDAMALGVPVLSTAVSDIPQVLDGAGWVVPPNDPTALGAAIRSILRDPQEVERRTRVARRRCVERYSWDAMEETLTPLVYALLDASDRASGRSTESVPAAR